MVKIRLNKEQHQMIKTFVRDTIENNFNVEYLLNDASYGDIENVDLIIRIEDEFRKQLKKAL